ncbi:DUF11 domain-containing protein, partial [Candidatus Microgenomates bacterium]|nr:DUF11 domain-containing protein [Candidatus Microgenomates bacterium]
ATQTQGQQTIEVQFNPQGLMTGTYSTTIKIGSNDPIRPMVEVPVVMTVTEVVPPPVQADFWVSVISTPALKLNYTGNQLVLIEAEGNKGPDPASGWITYSFQSGICGGETKFPTPVYESGMTMVWYVVCQAYITTPVLNGNSMEIWPEGASEIQPADNMVTFTLKTEWPVMKVTLEASPDPVQAGAPLTYTLRITNTGNTTLNGVVTDTLPANVTPTGDLNWSLTDLTPNDVWIKTVVVTAEMGYVGPLTNVVQVTTLEGATGIVAVTTQVVEPPRPRYRLNLPIVMQDSQPTCCPPGRCDDLPPCPEP